MPSKNFTIDDDAVLEQMRLDTERETQGKVVRDALTFYKYVLDGIKKGEKIFMGTNIDSAQELLMRQFEPAKPPSPPSNEPKRHLRIVP